MRRAKRSTAAGTIPISTTSRPVPSQMEPFSQPAPATRLAGPEKAPARAARRSAIMTGRGAADNPTSWNSAHGSSGRTQANLVAHRRRRTLLLFRDQLKRQMIRRLTIRLWGELITHAHLFDMKAASNACVRP